MQKLDQYALKQVYLDNVRTHQIGGETDGMTVEEAEDLGFYSPERYDSPLSEATPTLPVADVPTGRLEEKPTRTNSNTPGLASRLEAINGLSEAQIAETQATIHRNREIARTAVRGSRG